MNNTGLFANTSANSTPSIMSRIDNTLEIDKNHWVVSLICRKKAKSSRHAFILLEGIDGQGLGIVNRYDLVLKENTDDTAAIILKGLAQIDLTMMHEEIETLVRYAGFDDELFYRSWRVSPEKGIELHTAIQQDTKREDLVYCVIGDRNPSSNGGDNCFTWARKKINNMQATGVSIETKYADFFVANPRLYLSSEPTTSCLVM
jgi:hypothetical protein